MDAAFAALRSSARCARQSRPISRCFLMRFFETRTLIPFAVYCIAAGAACAIYFATT